MELKQDENNSVSETIANKVATICFFFQSVTKYSQSDAIKFHVSFAIIIIQQNQQQCRKTNFNFNNVFYFATTDTRKWEVSSGLQACWSSQSITTGLVEVVSFAS